MSDFTGLLPEPAAGGLVVFLGCDTAYAVAHAVPFAYALDAAAPGHRLHVHLVNPAEGLPEAMVALAEDLAATALTVTEERPDLSGFAEAERRTYYAASRFVRCAQVMEAAPAGYLVLDADSLPRRPLGEAAAALADGADLGLVVEENAPEHMRIKAGAVLVAPTQAGRRFLGAVAANIAAALGAGHAPWFLDQVVLAKVLGAMRTEAVPPPSVHRFSPGFLDWHFTDAGVVWTGKGPRKDADPRYRALAETYAGRFAGAGVIERFWAKAA